MTSAYSRKLAAPIDRRKGAKYGTVAQISPCAGIGAVFNVICPL